MEVKEEPPVHFNKVKTYLSDRKNVLKISTSNFTIDEGVISRALDGFKPRPNVYAILIKKPSSQLWSLKYIGERKSKGIRQRLREHFIYCNGQTGSQWERVKKALADGYEIGIKLVSVLPDETGHEHHRLVYESMLIREFSDELEWNTQR
jgi:hypothetical protein